MKWKCLCCHRILGRKNEPHNCVKGYTKNWRKMEREQCLLGAFTRFYQFKEPLFFHGWGFFRAAYIMDFENEHSQLNLEVFEDRDETVFRFKTGLVIIAGEQPA